METSLQGRRALVTGAGSGIGAAIAEAFAREGAHVAVHARSDERARPTVDAIEAAGGRAFAAAADLRDRAAIAPMCAAAIERLGGLDILVNNAGTFIRKPVAEMDLASWDSMVETNLTAAFLATQASLPALRRGRVGSIRRVLGHLRLAFDRGEVGGAGAYSAGWGAVYAMTKNGLNAGRLHALSLASERGRGAAGPAGAAGRPRQGAHRAPAGSRPRMAQDAPTCPVLAADLGSRLRDPLAASRTCAPTCWARLVTTDRCGSYRRRHGGVPGERARPPHHGAGAHRLRRLPARRQRPAGGRGSGRVGTGAAGRPLTRSWGREDRAVGPGARGIAPRRRWRVAKRAVAR